MPKVVARAVLTFATRRARKPIVHARAVALPPLVLAAVNVATRLADGAKHTVALDSFPHVLAARDARLAIYGARLVGKRPFEARSAPRSARVVHRRSSGTRRLLGAARRCIEARFGRRALSSAREIRSSRVRARLARQRSASTFWTVVTLRAWDLICRCVCWAVVASGAKPSTQGCELPIDIVCRGTKEPGRARNRPLWPIVNSRKELLQNQPQNCFAKSVAGRENLVPWAGLDVVRRLYTIDAAGSCGWGQRLVLAATIRAGGAGTRSIHDFALARVGVVPRRRRQHEDDLGGPDTETIVCKPRPVAQPQPPTHGVKRGRESFARGVCIKCAVDQVQYTLDVEAATLRAARATSKGWLACQRGG